MANQPQGPFSLPKLPYAEDDLDPAISAETVNFHYGKHHKGYVAKLNELVADTPFSDMTLEDVIRKTRGSQEKKTRTIFNNAAQIWNHDFFWVSLSPRVSKPSQDLAAAIDKNFGSMAKFAEQFVAKGGAHFGSGWVWLIAADGKLSIEDTHDADNPLVHEKTAILTCDVWEHAYYLDTKNDRAAFLKSFTEKLANWEHASSLFAGHAKMSAAA